MWSYCQWTALRPVAGGIISCEPMRSSGKRMTALSASVWMGNHTAQPWPANRAVKTLLRSQENAVPSVKVQRVVFFLGGGELQCICFYIYHNSCLAQIYLSCTLAHIPHVGPCGPAALPQKPCRHGLIKGEATEHSSSCRVLCVPLLPLPAKMRPTCVYEAAACF